MTNVSHEPIIKKSTNTGIGIIKSDVITCGAINRAIAVNNSIPYIIFRFISLLFILIFQPLQNITKVCITAIIISISNVFRVFKVLKDVILYNIVYFSFLLFNNAFFLT